MSANLGKNTFILAHPFINRAQIPADIDTAIIGILAFQRVVIQPCVKRIDQKNF